MNREKTGEIRGLHSFIRVFRFLLLLSHLLLFTFLYIFFNRFIRRSEVVPTFIQSNFLRFCQAYQYFIPFIQFYPVSIQIIQLRSIQNYLNFAGITEYIIFLFIFFVISGFVRLYLVYLVFSVVSGIIRLCLVFSVLSRFIQV